MRVQLLGGLDAGSDRLIDLLDSIPLIPRSRAVSVVRDLENAVADAAEKRVTPKVESAVKKGIIISVGASAAIGLFVLWRTRR